MKNLYRCTVKFGHAGSGHYTEKHVFVRARNILEAMDKARYFPGVKKGAVCRSAASVLQVVRAA